MLFSIYGRNKGKFERTIIHTFLEEERKIMIMQLSEVRTLIVEDNIEKYIDIKRALNYCGISKIESKDTMEDALKLIEEGLSEGQPFALIVTDMYYRLEKGGKDDPEAGFKLIKSMKQKSIEIPVIICSSVNYRDTDVLGTVWYNPLCNLNQEFHNVLQKLV